MIRGVLSIFAGMVLWAVLWLSGNAALAAALPNSFRPDGSTTSTGLLLVLLVWSVLDSLLAGYLTGSLARRGVLTHTLVLGAIQLGIGIVVQIGYWDALPLWHHLTFLVLLLPGNVAGGWLHQLRHPSAA